MHLSQSKPTGKPPKRMTVPYKSYQSEIKIVTTIEVIDTAVKIGLGALINSVAAYFLTMLHQQSEVVKEKLRRRRVLPENVSIHFQKFIDAASRLRVKTADIVDRKCKGLEIPTHYFQLVLTLMRN